jgi:sulfoxide reductase heme-binding subunit YedZ
VATKADRKLLLGKIVLFALALVPIVLLGWAAFNDDLGPNPVETLQRKTGLWTFNFLMLTLAVSPLRQMMELPLLIRFRRMLGLFVFFYATAHMLTYIGFDQNFDLGGIVQDIIDRRFITVGFAAWVLMLPLAATSTNRIIRWMGGERWQALQRLVYVVGVLGAIHYLWLAKGVALLWPIGYAALLTTLFGWRLAKRVG